MKRYLGVILFRGEKTPFLESEDRSLLASMLSSMRRCVDIRQIVIMSPPDCPLTESMAHLSRRLKLRYLSLNNWWSFGVIRLCLSVICSKGLVLVPASYPFVQGVAIRFGITQLERAKADIVTFRGYPEGSTPLVVMRRGYSIRGGFGIGLAVLSKGRWGRSLSSFVRGERARLQIVDWNDSYDRRPTVSLMVKEREDIDRLKRVWPAIIGRSDFIEEMAASRGGNDQAFLQLLSQELRTHPQPHLLNERINSIEMNTGQSILRSYPVMVGLNLTPLCNARCIFCTYDPKELLRRDVVTVDAIRQMAWLRYVSYFHIWAGIGDSLAHPRFIEIFDHIRESYSHLQIHLSTNGVALTPAISDGLVGRLDTFNCSYDAALPETFKKLKRIDRWKTIYDNLKYMSRKRKETRTAKPEMFASMVMARENLQELDRFVEIAHELALDGVTFSHFVTTTTIGTRPLNASSSLYYCKDLADRHLAAAVAKARRYGLKINAPPLFSDRDVNITYGGRSKGPAWDVCTDPWKVCYLTVNELGVPEMVFCCSGVYYHLEYDKNDLGEMALWRLWNHPTAQYFRLTANRPGRNSLCEFCKSQDRFDPENQRIYQVHRNIDPLFKKLAKESDLCRKDLEIQGDGHPGQQREQ